MRHTFLDFEQPIADLQAKIEELRYVHEDSAVDISDEINRLTKKSQLLTKEIYSKLSSWQIAQVARHPQRPYTLDYIAGIFTDFHELHGDRSYGDDQAIVGGMARFNGNCTKRKFCAPPTRPRSGSPTRCRKRSCSVCWIPASR